MGGHGEIIKASSIKELEQKARTWARRMWKSDFEVDVGWDRARVEKTKTGYRIKVHAHT